MVSEDVMKALEKINVALSEFMHLVDFEYTRDNKCICNNRNQVSEECAEWFNEYLVAIIDELEDNIDYFKEVLI